MDTDKTLNDILVNLFNDLMDIEDKCLITGEFRNISNNDMHVIEAIGIEEPRNMSEVARRLNITTGPSRGVSTLWFGKNMWRGTGARRIRGSCVFH